MKHLTCNHEVRDSIPVGFAVQARQVNVACRVDGCPMSIPCWRELGLHSGLLAEEVPNQDRLVIWRPCGDALGFRRWERIATVAHSEVFERDGMYVTAAASIPARQCATVGIIGWFRRMQALHGEWLRLPTGETLEKDGARRTDLLLVWPCDYRVSIDAELVKRHWPTASSVERLGEHLFVVLGVTPGSGSASIATDVVESSARTKPQASAVCPPRAAQSYPPKVKLPHATNSALGIGLWSECQFRVEVNETEIVSHRPGGKIERVAFADLRAVIIETNDLGPVAPDVLWILLGDRPESGCVYPQGATGEQDAMNALLKLPGFDYEQFFRAMKSTDNASFLCWHAAAETALNADPPQATEPDNFDR